jgi:osmotically-inducible protein OsmY
MKRTLAIAALASVFALGTLGGCAITRGQESTGQYVDDSAITTKIKAKYAEDKTVGAMSITVETLRGVVQLSGFAKNADEKAMAEKLARNTTGVVDVKNNIQIKG